jgi:hypothetical protein
MEHPAPSWGCLVHWRPTGGSMHFGDVVVDEALLWTILAMSAVLALGLILLTITYAKGR